MRSTLDLLNQNGDEVFSAMSSMEQMLIVLSVNGMPKRSKL